MKKLLKKLIPETSGLRLLFHRTKALFAAIRYGFPAKKLTVIGVTGTDGKTTTVGMVAHILHSCGIKTGAISTAFFRIGDETRWNSTQKTSPSPFLIQKFLRELVSAGCTHAVIECSSHGLLQGRVNHVYPAVAGVTNISEEHLDYHGSMQDYLAAKSTLFSMLYGMGTKVLHVGDRSFPVLSQVASKQTILYAFGEMKIDSRSGPALNLWLEEVSVTPDGSTATLIWSPRGSTQETRIPLSLSVKGAFNLENALCAIGCVLGLPDAPPVKEICAALASFTGVQGRMQRVDEGQNFTVYIDFTVTPKSYEATLTTLRSMLQSEGRLLVLTGSCGDRMKEKRPMIGNICSTLADITVVTNEDPYSEDPEKIIDEVLAGVAMEVPIFRDLDGVPAANPSTYCLRLSDRLEAIRFLLQEAQAGDIVLFAGKGSDTTMMTATGQIPWNEREIISNMLRDPSIRLRTGSFKEDLSR